MDDAGDSRPASDGVAGFGVALLDDDELHDVLQRLTLLARHTVGSSQSASITVRENGRYRTSNSTGPDALAVDDAQYQGDDGPCVEAIRSGRQLSFTAEETGDRWPRFQEEATKAGIVATLSTPLMREPDNAAGALNIYAAEDGGFRSSDYQTAELIGGVAAILVSRSLALRDSTRLNDQLRQAVATREMIGAAKGILMETQGCNRDEAFDILRRASQRENRKLRELAEELVVRVESRNGKAGRRRP